MSEFTSKEIGGPRGEESDTDTDYASATSHLSSSATDSDSEGPASQTPVAEMTMIVHGAIPHEPQSSNVQQTTPSAATVYKPIPSLASDQAPMGIWKGRRFTIRRVSPHVVDCKVRALVNKLTMERFDSISDHIIVWANKSEMEKDGRTLVQVIRLIFEAAIDQELFSEVYARLCRKMMEQISPNVRDDGIKNAEGKPIAGGQIFRKYLLNRCQEDFERGWVAKEATAAAALTKASEDQAVKAAAEQNKDGENNFSDEYYAAQKAKRQGLGLIKFIGELFKLQMLTERIMHECVKKLLGNVENPEEEEIESLCKLLTTVGQILDTPKARAHMDVYFSRIKELTKSPNVNSRMRFMLQDVIELRERKWVPRKQIATPMTLAAIHGKAAKEEAAAEKEVMNRTLNRFRGGSRRGGERGDHLQVEPDGWAVAGGPATRPASRAGDLSKFGQHITKLTPAAAALDDAGAESATGGHMSEVEAKTRIEEDTKEFFSIRDVDEAEVYFTKLPSEHRDLLVEKLVSKAIESKEADAQLVADLFHRAVSRNLCSPASFAEGFMPTAEMLDDIVRDAPQAFRLFAMMMKGAHLHKDERRRRRLASKSREGDRLLALLK